MIVVFIFETGSSTPWVPAEIFQFEPLDFKLFQNFWEENKIPLEDISELKYHFVTLDEKEISIFEQAEEILNENYL